MLRCPKCKSESRVIDTRESDNVYRRRRECMVCQGRWTTYEIAVDPAKLQATLQALLEAFGGHKEVAFPKKRRSWNGTAATPAGAGSD